MASWGVYTALAGFKYHGPSGKLSFSPRITPRDFRAAFTVAEGYGVYSQIYDSEGQTCSIEMKRGRVVVSEFAVTIIEGTKPRSIGVTIPGTTATGSFRHEDGVLTVTFERPVVIEQGFTLTVNLGR